ncbi:MAG: cyclic-phosphate processing receiver domain-containing protein [Coprococcus sp.]
MKLWLDDLRPVPYGYEGAKSVNEAKKLIQEAEHNGIEIEALDLDHDVGDYADQGGDAIRLLDWLAERGTFYPVEIHTANPVGRANMERILARYWGEQYW